MAWHPLQQSRDSLRHPSQVYRNINFSKTTGWKPGHPISSGDESWFPVFEWRGKPSFHKHFKRSFPLGICMWEDPVFYASSEMDPEMPWLERSPNFPAEASCMLIVHITRWKDVWVPWRGPRKSPRPPLHLKNVPNMPLTTRKPRGVHCFKFWRCLTIF